MACIDAKVYPLARKDDSVVSDFHGEKVADPYRYLEDPDGDETRAFVDKLNAVSQPFLEACPHRQAIKDRLTAMWDYPKWGCPSKHGEKVLYVAEKPEGPGEVFLDPNQLSEDGTTAVTFQAFTKDGSLMAYGIAEKGSDWNTLKVKRFPSGEELADELTKLRYTSVAWLHDNSGFFYAQYPHSRAEGKGSATESNKNHSLYFHRLGTRQEQDVLVHHMPHDPDLMIGAETSECGNFLFISIDKGCDPTNAFYFVRLSENSLKEPLKLYPIADKFDAKYEYVTNVGEEVVVQTNHEAPMFKLMRLKLGQTEKGTWQTLVPESSSKKLNWACHFHQDLLLVSFLEDVKDSLFVHELQTGAELYRLPLEIGSVSAFFGRVEHSEVFYTFESDLNPGAVYRLDFAAQSDRSKPPPAQLLRQTQIPGLDLSLFTASQVFYPSKDGTRIPMFLLHRKDLAKDGSNPTILYGYGGFNIALTPAFSLSRLLWLDNFKGLYAVANLRGGSEYGERWHEAGMKERKQNVFDDFIAAADYLVAQGYTQPSRLVSHGASNGGLLVAATANQRPDLFQGVINRVGVLDMLRYHHFTIGHAWIPEYGNPDHKDDYAYISKYSPLHKVVGPRQCAGGQYPAMLIMTADHDDRVVPLHSLKFIAALYAAVDGSPDQKRPLLARVEVKAGHGAGKPTAKVIEELVDIYSFCQRVLDASWHHNSN